MDRREVIYHSLEESALRRHSNNQRVIGRIVHGERDHSRRLHVPKIRRSLRELGELPAWHDKAEARRMRWEEANGWEWTQEKQAIYLVLWLIENAANVQYNS